MKTVTKALGILGGIGAVVWAMRDRFISVTAPREPEPPTFRVVTPPVGIAEPETGPDDLTRVKGIGPTIAERLAAAGVSNLADLASADPDGLAEATAIAIDRIRGWQEQASLLTS